jgi:hypothetical protein
MTASRRGRWPAALPGMLGLVLAVELFLTRHPRDFLLYEGGDWGQAGRAARRLAAGCEVLCFGDSQVKLGVQPRVLEPLLGRRAYNLAVAAGPPPASFFLLRRALEASARPAAILVDFHPQLLQADPWTRARYWPELVTTREALALARTARDAGLFASVMLDRLIPSLRGRHQIRANLVAALQGRGESGRAATLLSLRRNWRVNRGAGVAAKNPRFTGEVGAGFAEVYPDQWPLDPVATAYVRRFLRLAASHEIPVLWLIPPFCPEIEARRDSKGLSAQYDRFVRAMQARFPNVVVADARRSGYGPGVFIDPVHLDRQGAATLSADVAAVLGRVLAGRGDAPRWVELPAYRDRSAEFPLEDASQSCVALSLAGREALR